MDFWMYWINLTLSIFVEAVTGPARQLTTVADTAARALEHPDE